MADKKTFLQAVQSRRTYYALNKEIPISDDRVVELATEAIKHVPSSFNSQSTRFVILLKKEHETFWDFVLEVLKPLVSAEQLSQTEPRIKGFRAAYGSILFFEDPEPIHDLQKKMPIFADKFPQWSEHTSAMHQYVMWAGLEAEGLGCNLQHYNPVVDQKAQTHWKIPQEWSLKAQLVFGGIAGETYPKEHSAIDKRLFVHGK